MAFNSFEFKAGGDIRPNRFVKLSTAADRTLLEADANEQVIGVSQENTRDAPISGASALAAEAGDSVGHSPIGSYAIVEAGDTIVRGDKLKSDADGKAVPALATGTTVQWVSGRALESAASGEMVRILVESYPFRPALV